ncbi:hypothetical protein Tco_1168542 [Tanacetum coccineum]
MSLSAKVRMRAEYNIRERMRLNSIVKEKNSLLKARDAEIKTLKAQLLVKEVEAAEAIRLCTEVSKFEVVEKSLRDEVNVLKEQNAALEQESTDLGVKVAVIAASVKVRGKKLLTWMLRLRSLSLGVTTLRVHELETSSVGLQEKVTTYENCMAAISRAIEKGMQDGLVAGITHGQKGRVLTDIATFDPSAKIDYISALQELQDVNFSLLAKLKSNKDASTKTLMNILYLDEPLDEILGLDESQPHVDQLDNIANHRPSLHDVFVPLVESLSSASLEGTKDDYDVVHADGQEGTGVDGQTGACADVKPFPNVEDVELDIS